MASSKPRVLLVDDDPSIQKIYKKRLVVAGYEVQTCFDGEEALQQVRTHPPEVIILDIMLPKLNGYEVCSRLKDDAATKDIPIIMFTARGELPHHIAGFLVGANAYISKTCDSKLLLEQVQSLVKK